MITRLFVFFLAVLTCCFSYNKSLYGLEKNRFDPEKSFKSNILAYDMPIDKIIRDILKFRFIAIGENHTDYSNHKKQLEIIKNIHQANKNIAIGMEMFGAKYQKTLDEYLEGKMTEYEFLKSSQYFTEWGYDYLLYKEIIDYAKTNKIPVIGLNIENRIVRHIGRNGFRDMASPDFEQIPESIDFTNQAYKDYLFNIFQEHGNSGRSFDNFYLAQLIRDEQMSQVTFQYYQKNPHKTIIILAGNGHIEQGNGIPSRLERLSGKPCKTILIDSAYHPGSADYFVFTQSVNYKKSPQLNVILHEDENGVIISAVLNQSENGNQKMMPKDRIISIDGNQIKSIGDVRLQLYMKKTGEQFNITLLRENKIIEIQFTPEMDQKED